MFKSEDEDDTLTNKLARINTELPIDDYQQEKGGKYHIKVLDYKFFKAFKDVLCLKSIKPNKGVVPPLVVDIRQLKYTPEGKVFFILDLKQPWKNTIMHYTIIYPIIHHCHQSQLPM